MTSIFGTGLVVRLQQDVFVVRLCGGCGRNEADCGPLRTPMPLQINEGSLAMGSKS